MLSKKSMEIIITKHFQKEVNKIKSASIDDITEEIKKYNKGLNNLIDLYSPNSNTKLLKGYLNSGKVRIAILLMINNNSFIPCLIVKKESRHGHNLSKETSENLLSHKINIIAEDIANNNYFEIKF